VFLNLGGVANVTWIGVGDGMLAFDTGPGNALIDDWVMRHAGLACDRDGEIAARGQVSQSALNTLLAHPYFDAPAPKSLDRDAFRRWAEAALGGLSMEDGAATLTAFTAAAISRASERFPTPAETWVACGGGRRNPILMREISRRLERPLRIVDELGWDGDALEAMAFAYLAMRSIKGLALSFPGTTGVGAPQTGGRRHFAPRS
jgi:anhydro-N-acetylmuramic acid kinase